MIPKIRRYHSLKDGYHGNEHNDGQSHTDKIHNQQSAVEVTAVDIRAVGKRPDQRNYQINDRNPKNEKIDQKFSGGQRGFVAVTWCRLWCIIGNGAGCKIQAAFSTEKGFGGQLCTTVRTTLSRCGAAARISVRIRMWMS